MARIGEEWLPSKKAEAELAALKIAEQKRLADEAKFKADVRKFETGAYIPETGVSQEDYTATEARLRGELPDRAAELRRLHRELTPDVQSGISMPAVGLREPKPPTPEQIEAQTPRTMKQYSREVVAEAKKQMSDKDFAKAQAAARTAAGLWPMMRRSGFKGQTPKDAMDFTTYFRGVTGRGIGGGRRLKFKSREMQLAYDAVQADADDALRGRGDYKKGVPVFDKDGKHIKTLRGRNAAMHIIRERGIPLSRAIRDGYTGQGAKTARAKAILKSKAAIAAEKIKLLQKKIDAGRADAKDRQDYMAHNMSLRQARFDLEVMDRATGSTKQVTDEFGMTKKVVTEPTLTPEQAGTILEGTTPPVRPTPAQSPANLEPLGNESMAAYGQRLKAFMGHDAAKAEMKKRFNPDGTRK